MAVFLFLMAAIGGVVVVVVVVVVVGDLVLENPSAGEATVFTQPISGYRQGVLLAMAAALGVVIALLLVASMTSTQRRRARRKQLRAIRAAIQRRAAAPAGSRPACWMSGSAARCPSATTASQPDEPPRSKSCRAVERIRQHVFQAHQRAG
jgi:hypothetical protein